jgi:hypothetical protein
MIAPCSIIFESDLIRRAALYHFLRRLSVTTEMRIALKVAAGPTNVGLLHCMSDCCSIICETDPARRAALYYFLRCLSIATRAPPSL